ncbi:MAG TPA: peptidoglycan DD-metalloendopeptidase family protein [Steroidobacteraceae bacterium]|nr:peptidoglycan DD-metalloendopeptidase family protein [Steroidobacteraceae bacterium]
MFNGMPSKLRFLRAPSTWRLLGGCAVLGCGLLLGSHYIHRTPGLKTATLTASARQNSGAAASTSVQPAAAVPGTSMQPTAAAPQAAAGIITQPATHNAPTALVPIPGPTLSNVTVGRNDTLERIFRRMQLDLVDLATLRALPGLKAHLDELRPGETLAIESSDGHLVGLKRRLSVAETLQVIKDGTSFRADVLQIPLEIRSRTVTGTIDSSLFEAMTAAGAHDQTAVSLADIFAYDIDFVLDIQPGDSFTVTYEEIFENGKYLQDGPILAARFVTQGREYVGLRYVSPSGKVGYYSAEGRSLRKAFLRAPLEFTRVSSPFTLHRRHPILNLIRAHTGVDYAAPIGTPVRAAGEGRILFAGRRGGYGNLVEIDHSRGIHTVYGHLSRFARGIRPGRFVEQGAVIAYVGMTGLATGPHLHYEYRVNGVYRNPQTVNLPDAGPIEPDLLEDFISKTRPLIASLYLPTGPALVSR